jgi:hypothetical protein
MRSLPCTLLRWPDGWTVEDVVGWIAGANAPVVIAAIGPFEQVHVERRSTDPVPFAGKSPSVTKWDGSRQPFTFQRRARWPLQSKHWLPYPEAAPCSKRLIGWSDKVARQDAKSLRALKCSRPFAATSGCADSDLSATASTSSRMTVHQARNREFEGVVVMWPYTVTGDAE